MIFFFINCKTPQVDVYKFIPQAYDIYLKKKKKTFKSKKAITENKI